MTLSPYLMLYYVLLNDLFVSSTAATVDPQKVSATAERVHGGGGRDALFRMEYDMVVSLAVMLVVFVLWVRAAYQHWTVQPKPDKYKPKYH